MVLEEYLTRDEVVDWKKIADLDSNSSKRFTILNYLTKVGLLSTTSKGNFGVLTGGMDANLKCNTAAFYFTTQHSAKNYAKQVIPKATIVEYKDYMYTSEL